MEILEHQSLEMHNVLSFRGKLTQQELAQKSKEIEKLLADCGAKRAAPTATTTFSVEQGPQGPVMDVEILLPLDKEIPVPAGYVWKPHFLLTNALMVRHIGNPGGMQSTVNALNTYILENKLVPISTGYNVTVKEAKTPLELDEMEVNIYVGISPNIL